MNSPSDLTLGNQTFLSGEAFPIELEKAGKEALREMSAGDIRYCFNVAQQTIQKTTSSFLLGVIIILTGFFPRALLWLHSHYPATLSPDFRPFSSVELWIAQGTFFLIGFHLLFQCVPVGYDQCSDLFAARSDDYRLRDERTLLEQTLDLQRRDVFSVR